MKNLAQILGDSDCPFSSSLYWKKVVDKDPTPYNLLQLADQLRLSGSYAEAEEILQKVEISEIPKDYKFIYFLRWGTVYEDQGKFDNAIESYKKCIKTGTDETYPYVFLASLLSNQSKLNEVENILHEALKKKDDIDEVYYNLSTNYARKGNFIKAIEMMKKCLEIDPNYPGAENFLKDFGNIVLKTK